MARPLQIEMLMLRAYLLGGLALAGRDPLPPIRSRAARSLLAYLLTHRDRPHTRDLLAGTFWPDLPDATARRRLTQALWQIRTVLSPQPLLLTEGDTVQLNPEMPIWIDAVEFERQAGPTATLQAAVDLYRGEFLAGYYDDWTIAERERLHDILLDALGRLTEAYKANGEHERALGCARRLAAEDPWREQAHREVMRLCHLLGRDAEALKQYELCCQVLADDLGAEPSAETSALADEIAARAGQAGPPLLPSAARPVLVPLLERPDRLPLVGREAELAGLLSQVEAAIAGHGGLAIIYGEAGVGKSRLLRELAGNARWRGVQTAWGRCYEMAAPAAYQPFVEVLRACLPALSGSRLAPVWRACLAHLMPELAGDGDPLPVVSPDEERRRLLEAIVQALAALAEVAPHLILLEDTHWIDPASLEALHYLLPRVADSYLLVVVTVRGEELAGQTAAALRAMEDTRLPYRLKLRRLDAAATGELVQRALGLERPAPRFSARLYAETEGNPFFVVEALRTLVEEGLLVRDKTGVWSTPWDDSTQDYAELPLPAGVVQSIASRLERLPAALKELLDLAATIGRWLEFRLWLAASGREEEELLAAGDDLCARGLLLAADPTSGRATTGADYTFAHDLIRRVAYEHLTGPRRRLYHRRVAEALARFPVEIVAPAEPATLAFHWTRAEVWDQAADCHQRAGERAQRVYANAEAVGHFTQALEALGHLPGPANLARCYDLHLAREAVYDLLGERAAQAEDLQALAVLAESLADDGRRAEVALRQGRHAERISDGPAAIAAVQRAIRLAQAIGDVSREASGHLQWGQVLVQGGDLQAAHLRLEQALDLARAAGLPPIEAASLLSRGEVSFAQGDYDQASAAFTQALALYRTIGDRRGESQVLRSLGRICGVRGDIAGARGCFEQTLPILQEIGDRQGEGETLRLLGSVFTVEGDFAQAETYYERALRISREISHRRMEGVLLGDLATLYDRRCEYARARSCAEEALRLCREVGNRAFEGALLVNLGIEALCQGDYGWAQTYAEQARSVCQENGDRRYEGWALQTLGRISFQRSDYAQAGTCYEQALSISREIGDLDLEGGLLYRLSLLSHTSGQDATALDLSREALRIARGIGDPDAVANGLAGLGHALTGVERLDEAADAYQQAADLRRQVGQLSLAMEAVAGVARVALAQGDLAQAQACVTEILGYLEGGGALDGTEEPMRIYLTCNQALQANQDPRADALLKTAHRLLQEAAARIEDEALRRSYLENVAAHRQIIAAYQQRQAARQIEVRLPRSSAPLGRPLRDDEQVTVTWTVAAAEDEAVADKATRRRQRLVRLLREAQAQGAVPAHQHLAHALKVSQRTIERDVALLRDQEEPLPPTRGEMSAQSEPTRT